MPGITLGCPACHECHESDAFARRVGAYELMLKISFRAGRKQPPFGRHPFPRTLGSVPRDFNPVKLKVLGER